MSQIHWDVYFSTTRCAITLESRRKLLSVHKQQAAKARRVKENEPAPNSFFTLAAMRPGELKVLFDCDLEGRKLPGIPEADLYALYFGDVPADHKSQLERRLFGQRLSGIDKF